MSHNAQKQISFGAVAAGIIVFLVGLLVFGWNIIICAILAVGGYLAAAQFTSKSAEPQADSEPRPAAEATSPVPEAAEAPAETQTVPEVAPAPEPTPEPVTPSAAMTPAMAGQVKLGTLLPGEKELSEQRGAWRYTN